MYKKLIVLLGCLILFLHGCTPTKTDDKVPKEDDKIPGQTDEDTFRYKLSTSNFENFYEVTYNMEITSDTTYDVIISVVPKKEFESSNVSVFIYLAILDTRSINDYEMGFNARYHGNELLHLVFEDEPYHEGQNPYISRFYITVDSGDIIINENVQLKFYGYPRIYDNNYNAYFYIENKEENKQNYDDFMSFVSSIDGGNSNYFTLTTKQSSTLYRDGVTTKENSELILKTQREPYYVEILSGNMHEVIHKLEDSNDYVVFSPNHPIFYMDKIVIKPTRIAESSFNGLNSDLTSNLDQANLQSSYNYDFENMLFTTIENGYMVKGYMRQFLGTEQFDLIKSVYQQVNLDTSILENTIVTLSVTEVDDKFHIQTDMMFNFTKPVELSIHSSVEMTLDFASFEPIYVSDEQFNIMPPASIDQIIYEIDPYKTTIMPEANRLHYYKVWLEKGQYFMRKQNNQFDFRILDENELLIPEFVTYGEEGYGVLKDIFEIPEDGYYYFKAEHSQIIYPYEFYIEKLEAPIDIKEPKPLILGTNQIQITHKYDLDYFVFETDKDVVLELESNGLNLNYIYIKDLVDKDLIHKQLFFESSYKTWLYLEQGLHEFYFYRDEPIDVTLNIKDYGPILYRDQLLEDMPYITDTFFDDAILLGGYLEHGYIRLDATHGLYQFSYDATYMDESIYIYIYEAQTHKLTAVIDLSKEEERSQFIEAGSYYIRMGSGLYLELNLKVDYEIIEPVYQMDTLDTIEDGNIPNESLPFISGYKYYDKHEVYHEFTLEERAMIVIDTSLYNHKLYDDVGKLLTFSHLLEETDRLYYNLDPGTYKLEVLFKEKSQTFVDYKIGIAVLNNPYTLDSSLLEPRLYEDDVPIYFTKDNPNDYEVVIVTVDERGLYTMISNYDIYVYNENLELVNIIPKNSPRNTGLAPGIYYIVSSIHISNDLYIGIKRS